MAKCQVYAYLHPPVGNKPCTILGIKTLPYLIPPARYRPIYSVSSCSQSPSIHWRHRHRLPWHQIRLSQTDARHTPILSDMRDLDLLAFEERQLVSLSRRREVEEAGRCFARESEGWLLRRWCRCGGGGGISLLARWPCRAIFGRWSEVHAVSFPLVQAAETTIHLKRW